MQRYIVDFLAKNGLKFTHLTMCITAVVVIVATALIIHFFLHKIVLVRLELFSRKSSHIWVRVITQNKVFNRVAFALQGVIVLLQTNFWIQQGVDQLSFLIICASLWILLFTLLSIFSLLDIILDISMGWAISARLPLGGIFQSVKLLAALIFGIMMISTIVGKSPWILISGLGAMAAVIMLVFKDPILGFVAGIQLSANNMLKVNDWLQMSQYGADGTVTNIGLTTVKVQNFDNTITMVPTYSLVSNSFINWRGMQESGGRRIKRSIYIDVTSIRFLSNEELMVLSKSQLLHPYIDAKSKEIGEFNKEKAYDLNTSVLNGRRMTNIGLYRAYLEAYLLQHPCVHKGMTCMVRQMAPDATGLPLEIYCFSNTTAWKEYEDIQSDIFDHSYAIISQFYLSPYQNPSGNTSTVMLIQPPSTETKPAA